MSEKTITEKEVRLSCVFRLAKPEDLKVSTNQLRYGQLCANYSKEKEDFDGGFFTLNANTDVNMIKELLQHNQLYVPVDYFENTIKEEKL